ncbi:MAG TPA: Trk system potassium transporter TrkA [Anaerovoracaceae bacterium]|nr:Trk system potassium transporter TrkA [Anaerovoracaceae bacterium]
MKVAIVGAGKLGLRIAEALVDGDYEITIIDKNEDLLDKISQKLDVLTVYGDAKKIDFLKSIQINTYDFLFAASDSDEVNILIASFSKALGCRYVSSRVRDPEHMKQIDFIREKMNIDFIVNPDLLITQEIHKYLAEKYTLSNGVFTSGKIALLEFKADMLPKLIGLYLPDFKKIYPSMLIVGISRKGKMIIPHGDDFIKSGDSLYIIGEKETVFKLNTKVYVNIKYTNVQKVMIIGGGKTGYYLASRLSEFGVNVKLIEKSKERCQYLSTRLDDVMVLYGDGTDLQMLQEENLDEMDAFVTATGYDEENLLLALTAKQHGIEDVISKVSRVSYKDLIEQMGIDMVLNPLDITASAILRNIRGSKKVLSSVLLQGQAELLEIYAYERMNMLNIPLKNLQLPEGIIIAAIHRGNKVIIPDGNTRLLRNDKVIIVSLLTEIGKLEKLFKYRRNIL